MPDPHIVLEAESALTDRYQTTVPDAVRRALRLTKRDRLIYRVGDDGTVQLARKDGPDDDPVIGRFLDFLSQDLAHHPERLRSIDAALVDRLRMLASDVAIDLDAPLDPDDE